MQTALPAKQPIQTLALVGALSQRPIAQQASWTPIAIYILFAGAVSLIAALVMRETRGVSLLAIDEADARRTDILQDG